MLLFFNFLVHTSKQSDGEAPELEDINDENDIPRGTWDMLDKATEPTSNQVFITEGATHGESGQAPPSTDTSTTCEEIPLITPKIEPTSHSQEGLFSTQSTAKQNSLPPSSLIIGTSPSPSSLLKEDKDHHSDDVGFKPLIEVVSSTSKKSDDGTEHGQPFSKPLLPSQTSSLHSSKSETSSSSVSVSPLSHDSYKLAESSIGDKLAAISSSPGARELDSDGHWAVRVNSAKTEPPSTRPDSGCLLIEEIDNDFNIGHLPLTAEEQEAIAKANAVLEKIQNRPISELNQEERVWQLAASAGSTSLEGGGADLDDETKTRLRERLTKSGLVDKTSLKF